jgi:tRNA pseudouridine65 synthase
MIEILHRDGGLLVVNKPAGLVTHRSAMANDRDVVMTRVRNAIGAYVWPLHRLDRGTSGALAFALSEQAARTFCAAFENGAVEKTYVALVRGEAPERVRVDHPIPKGEGKERVPAVTEFSRLWRGSHCSLVEARPHTGRFHQIRRHLSHLRHPIANDSNYGTGWFNRKIRNETGLLRLALHAVALRIGETEVRAPLAPDFAKALRLLDVPGALVDSLVSSRGAP